ncbi:protein of unknown function [Paenibacillus alvei]|uniref:Uncharacterized protein n=1 Tax=Paenibacillus alvei TaxID=44250 RepID=A0A383RIB5_PAEAL|nr:protein of unknown function [Paenibacillus alvei]
MGIFFSLKRGDPLVWTSLHRNDFRSDVIQLAAEMAQYVGHFYEYSWGDGRNVHPCLFHFG